MSPVVGVIPGFFRDMGIPILEGTEPEPAAGAERSVVVSESLARRLWGAESAVGKRFRFLPGDDWMRVAGVVGHVRQWGLTFDEGLPLIFSTYGAWRPHPSPELAIRSAVDPENLVPELKARRRCGAIERRLRRSIVYLVATTPAAAPRSRRACKAGAAASSTGCG